MLLIKKAAIIIPAAGLIVCWGLSAAVTADTISSADQHFIAQPPGARLTRYIKQSAAERYFPQGAINRLNGRNDLENPLRISGKLTSLTYLLPKNHDPKQALNKSIQQLIDQNALLLHYCQGRDCGSSNGFANDIFAYSLLYGPDDGQAYALLQSAPPLNNTFLALYAISRGNQQGYLQVDRLITPTPEERRPTPNGILFYLHQMGRLCLPKTVISPEEPWINLLAQTLWRDGSLQLTLEGTSANAWQTSLIAKGIAASRLTVAQQHKEDGLIVKLRQRQ